MSQDLSEYEKLKAETPTLELFEHEAQIKGGSFQTNEFNRISAFVKFNVKNAALWQEKTSEDVDLEKLAGINIQKMEF